MIVLLYQSPHTVLSLSSNGHCPGHADQSQFTYSTDVTEHTYDEVGLGATRDLPSSPRNYEMEAPLQSRYDTPRRLYYNYNPDAYEVADEFVYAPEEYLQDHNPLNTQPVGAVAQEKPVPKPRQRSTFPRVNPTTAAPGHPSQSVQLNASAYIVMQPEDVVRQQAEEAAGRWGDDGGEALPAPLSAVANASMTGSVGSTDSQTGGYVVINQQRSTFPRVNPTTAAPGHLSQSVQLNPPAYIAIGSLTENSLEHCAVALYKELPQGHTVVGEANASQHSFQLVTCSRQICYNWTAPLVICTGCVCLLPCVLPRLFGLFLVELRHLLNMMLRSTREESIGMLHWTELWPSVLCV